MEIAKSAQENEDYEGVTFSADPNQISLNSFDQVYRIGAKNSSWSSRNILVSFKDAYHRHILLKSKPFLAEAENVIFYLEEDMTMSTRSHRSRMKRIVAAAKSENLEAKIAGNRVFIDGTPYGINDLDTIPVSVTNKSKEEKEVEEGGGITYRGRESIFSNFYPAPFEIDEVRYNSVEQYYQHCKAVACNNLERARKIMICTDPRRIKELGDGIRNDADWLPNRVLTLHTGVMAKFHQNPDLAIALISTGPVKLYEATTDKFFGCGIGLQSKKWDKREWIGENVAGRIVMKVRAELTGETIPQSAELSLDGSADLASFDYSSDKSNTGSQTLDESGTSEADNQTKHLSNPASNPNQSHLDNGVKPSKHHYHRHRRGKGRGSLRYSNVTDRSYRRQSTYKAQLSNKDQEFLKETASAAPNKKTGASSSTPKSPPGPNANQLSDSELTAMGIDPVTKYADDLRRKHSATMAGR